MNILRASQLNNNMNNNGSNFNNNVNGNMNNLNNRNVGNNRNIGNNRDVSNNIDTGRLQINVTSAITSFPVADATISISYTGVPEATLEQLRTNSSGQTETIELDAPPVELSVFGIHIECNGTGL